MYSDDIKELFATEFVKVKELKYRAICNTYKKLDLEITTKYKMYKVANELLEEDDVIALIDIGKEELKAKEIKDYKNEIIKTNKAIWDTLKTASTIENKLTKNGEIIEGFYKFQDSNVVVASLQILARQSDEIRKEIEKLSGVEEDKTSDIIKIEWK